MQLQVFVTDSLAEVGADLARAFEADHVGSKVQLTTAGDAALLAKLLGGAPCDVVALGDSSSMSRAAAAGKLAVGPGHAVELTRSQLALVVAPGNPKHLADVGDLLGKDIRYALGKRTSSVGRYGRWVLSRTGQEARPAVEADTAAELLALVRDGKADAAIVYATSIPEPPKDLARVELPQAENYPVLYSIAATRESQEPEGARAFQELALSPAGKAILRQHGFLPPP